MVFSAEEYFLSTRHTRNTGGLRLSINLLFVFAKIAKNCGTTRLIYKG